MTYSERYRCADCGEHHYLDCSIPSEVWNRIAVSGEALCAKCIDKRLVAAGISGVECRFYFVGETMTSESYGRDTLLDTVRDLKGWIRLLLSHIAHREPLSHDMQKKLSDLARD